MRPFIVSRNGDITVVVQGRPYNVQKGHPAYGRVKAGLQTLSDVELIRMFDFKEAVKSASNDKLELKDDTVHYNGQPLHHVVVDRIHQLLTEGLDVKPILLFLEKLLKNPSFNSQRELYDFLGNKGLPICEDGDFLAYKAVDSNYLDKYTCTISNKIGDVVRMTRPEVDDNRQHECSKGLHAGGLDYVRMYGNSVGDRIMIVKINPENVVSVPTDYNYQKLRTCEYEVVDEFKEELLRPVYDSNLNAVGSYYDEDDEEDEAYNVYEDEDYDEDDYYDDYDDEDDYDYDEYGYGESVHPVKTVKASTRQKLSRKATKQRRDRNGRFV